MRVRHAGGNLGRARLWPQQWLLIEWPAGEPEPTKYWLSTLPEHTSLNELVSVAHLRWRIERDYQELKQELGLGHYEGRGWRGFHHHASLTIAAYGFLIAEQLADRCRRGRQKKLHRSLLNAKCLPFPRITSLAEVRRAQRHVSDSITTLRHQISAQLAKHVPRCPCCGAVNGNLLL